MNKLMIILCLVACSAASAQFTNSTAVAIQQSFTNAGSALSAGDTVYIRAGTYEPPITVTNAWGLTPQWRISVSGATNNPVTFRSYPGERAVLNGEAQVSSQFAKFLDLEIVNSHKGYQPTNPSYPIGPWNGWDALNGPRIEIVNCYIHDVSMGFSGGFLGEMRGCILQYVGLMYADHVAYTSLDKFRGNISVWTAGSTVQLGRSSMEITDNIAIQNNKVRGAMSSDGNAQAEFLLVQTNVLFSNNVAYHPSTGTVLYHNGGTDLVAKDNNISAYVPVRAAGGDTVTLSNNSLYMNGYSSVFYVLTRASSSAGNWIVNSNSYWSIGEVHFSNTNASRTFSQWKTDYPTLDTVSVSHDTAVPPDSVRVFANRDDPKRAHIAINNWSAAANVSVSLAGVLSAGDTYQIINAENYSGGAIKTGTYNGTSISVPMTNLVAATVLYGTNSGSWGSGLVGPSVTSPEFAAFVVQGASVGSTAHAVTLNVGRVVMVQ